MVDDKTTIQISGYLRKRLKELSAARDISYEELIDDFVTIYEGLRFKNERDFSNWFEENLSIFEFESIKQKNINSYPDYVLINNKGKEVRAELEFMSSNFIKHKHDSKGVDIIISVYTTENEIGGVPVLSLYHGYPYVWLNVNIGDYTMRKIKARAAILGLSLKDYVTRVCLIDTENANSFKDAEEKITILCPKCKTPLIINKDDDAADCPLCNEEILVSQQEVME